MYDLEYAQYPPPRAHLALFETGLNGLNETKSVNIFKDIALIACSIEVDTFGPGITITDHNYGFILTLAISGIGVFGALLAG
ncbi:hypothetical protein HYPBUDRAFT_7324 [Hyphopichia burtonii NRRL Y-1933]|uniref:Uncharacterized protein n=1 Tax=Hyphopichia burtonii NRRL Y-1933 TaxID=984485 RepID=A0A1E4RFF5_9ASCO|nr:hypothetical protein HYPBUDRAFT_7324 [Hyphopichia burtonii NRRL Y-1933]ODV65999.1 hypothetical protein HYPBUDRAFT_7324 [Hyphopichia burtonii NRRL Y-1933]